MMKVETKNEQMVDYEYITITISKRDIGELLSCGQVANISSGKMVESFHRNVIIKLGD